MKIKNWHNMDVGQITFNTCVINPILIKEVLTWQQSNKRDRLGASVNSTKTFSDIVYSNKKVLQQKGTGRARRGGQGAPQQKGGYVCHGPLGRLYGYEMPKHKVRLALHMSICDKIKNNKFIVLDNFLVGTISTKNLLQKLENLQIKGQKVLFVGEKDEFNLIKSLQNLESVNFITYKGLNVWSLLKHTYVIVTKNVAELIIQEQPILNSRNYNFNMRVI